MIDDKMPFGALTGSVFVPETGQRGLDSAAVDAVALGTAGVERLFVRRAFGARRRQRQRLLIDVPVQQRRALVIVIGLRAVPRPAAIFVRPVQRLARRDVAHGRRVQRIRHLYDKTNGALLLRTIAIETNTQTTGQGHAPPPVHGFPINIVCFY